VLWVAVLMSNNQDPDIRADETIDDCIREAVKRKPATVVPSGDSKAGIRHKESRDAFEFVQKPLGNTTPGFSPVKARCLTKVALRPGCSVKVTTVRPLASR
jgi:hypothetical protein